MAIDTTQIARKAGLPAELAQNPHVVAALRLALFEGQQAVTGLAARHAQLQQAAADVLAQLSLVERDGFVEGGRGCEEFVVSEGAWLELLDCGRALQTASCG